MRVLKALTAFARGNGCVSSVPPACLTRSLFPVGQHTLRMVPQKKFTIPAGTHESMLPSSATHMREIHKLPIIWQRKAKRAASSGTPRMTEKPGDTCRRGQRLMRRGQRWRLGPRDGERHVLTGELGESSMAGQRNLGEHRTPTGAEGDTERGGKESGE